jgi:hypothetical protein
VKAKVAVKKEEIEPRTKKGSKALWRVMEQIWLGPKDQTFIDSRKGGDKRKRQRINEVVNNLD